jgi:hypothetical protein
MREAGGSVATVSRAGMDLAWRHWTATRRLTAGVAERSGGKMNIGLDLYAPSGLALVVFASSGDDERYQAQVLSIAEAYDDIRQRGLLVLGIFGNRLSRGASMAGWSVPWPADVTNPGDAEFGLSLVDRDGRVILKSSIPLPPAQIFQVIDAITAPTTGRPPVVAKAARRWMSAV